MDANRTSPWPAAISVAALVLALAALLVAINRGSGMMGGSGYRGHNGPGMMGGDRDDYGPAMKGRGGPCLSPGQQRSTASSCSSRLIRK